MNDTEYRDLDRFDLLAIGLMGVLPDVSAGRLLALITVGGLVLTATAYLAVGAFM